MDLIGVLFIGIIIGVVRDKYGVLDRFKKDG